MDFGHANNKKVQSTPDLPQLDKNIFYVLIFTAYVAV